MKTYDKAKTILLVDLVRFYDERERQRVRGRKKEKRNNHRDG